MAYTKHQLIGSCIASASIFAIAAIFLSLSGRYDQEVIQGFDAPETQIEISPSKPLRIPLPRTDKPFAGVVLYASKDDTTGTVLRAHIEDDRGNIITKKRTQKKLFSQNNRASIQIFFDTNIIAEKKQQFFLHISPYKGTYHLVGTPKESPVYALLFSEPVSASSKHGIYIGTALGLSIIALYYIRMSLKKQWVFAVVIICVYSILATVPYVFRQSQWGIFDWDYRYSLAHIYQTTIINFDQFPLWNPYICGGAAALGDPEFAFFTPSFLLQFLFGVENGTGLAITLGFIITGIGVLLLAKSLKLHPVPALVSVVIVLFGSALTLKTTEGHTTIIFAFMWVPWIFWAWVASYRANAKLVHRMTLLCGLFLTFALLQGGIYILSYTAVAFAALSVLVPNKLRALHVSFFAYIWMIGLGSFQLVPTLFWVYEFPDQAFVGSAYTYNNLLDIFFGRYPQNAYVLQNQLSRWHEYGAYIGYGVFAFILVGISYIRHSRIARILLIGLVTSLFVSSLGPLFEPIIKYLQFLPRSNISRLVLYTIVCGGLLAGFGVKRLYSALPPIYGFIPLIIIGFICIDLLSLQYPIAEQGFSVTPVSGHITHSAYPISHITESFSIRKQGNDTPRSYAAILSGYGTSSFCSVIGPKPAVVTADIGESATKYLQTDAGTTAKLLSWTPNKIVFSYTSSKSTDISINLNSARGWKTSIGNIQYTNPLLTVRVPAGTHTVKIQYLPPGMLLGIGISLVVCVFAALSFRRSI